jgi:hypothetical protein
MFMYQTITTPIGGYYVAVKIISVYDKGEQSWD